MSIAKWESEVVDVGILIDLFMVCEHTKYCLNLSDCIQFGDFRETREVFEE